MSKYVLKFFLKALLNLIENMNSGIRNSDGSKTEKILDFGKLLK